MSSVCLSVRVSVMLVDCDHIGWNSSEIISPLVSLGCSLVNTQTSGVYSKKNTRKFWPKVTHPLLIWASETFDRKSELLQISQRSQWRAYRKPQSLFLMVPSLTLYDLLPPKWGSICPQDTRMAISPQREIRYTSCLVLGSADRMALFPVISDPSWWQAAILDRFEWPYLRNGSFDPLI